MNQNFVEQKDLNHVVEGFNKLLQNMIDTKNVEAAFMKEFMEPYFEEAGYRGKKNAEAIAKSVLKSKSKHKKEKNNVRGRDFKNILIIHDSGVGDFILMSAVLREMRRTYPKAHITLLIPNPSLAIAEQCPYIDKVVLCDGTLVSYKDFFKVFKNAISLASHLLRRRIDLAFNFGQYPSSQLIAYMSGAKERIDHGWLGNFHSDFEAGYLPLDFFSAFSTFKVQGAIGGTHDNERYLHVLQDYAGAHIKSKELELWTSPMDNFTAEMNLQGVDGKMYALAMGGAQRAKHWEPEKFAKLINMILEEESVTFLILGGPAELADSMKVMSMVDPKHIINFTNKINYRQSAAILSFCDYYVGNDTGTMHAASAFKVPILSVNCFPADMEMSPMSFPRRYYPYGVPSVIVQPKHAYPECKASTKPFHVTLGCSSDQPHCINQIEPETVFQGYKLLKERVAENICTPLYIN